MANSAASALLLRAAPITPARRALGLALALLLAPVGCGPGNIEGTEIEATEVNVEIFDVVERYRKALEERDIDAISAVVSREYFENSGTTHDQTDDYGYDVLREKVLPVLRDNIKKVRVELRLIDIRVEGSRARADFEYSARFLYSEAGKDGWITKTDFNRLEFLREDGAWRIISGL